MSEKNISATFLCSLENVHKVWDKTESLIKAEVVFQSSDKQKKYLQDMQLVISEIFTNAVKYSNDDYIKFNYDFKMDHMHIIVETVGKGFCIKPHSLEKNLNNYEKEYYPPYPESIVNEEILIYHDSENEIRCFIKTKDQIEFKHYNIEFHDENILELNEHYGLYLINALCDEVIYENRENEKQLFSIKKFFNK